MEIKFDEKGNLVKDQGYKDFKTDYLIGMTRVYSFVEGIKDELKVKYKLTTDEYVKLADFISNEQIN